MLCAVPSVSLAEAALADVVEEWLRTRAPGLEIVRHGDNVVARTRGTGGRIVLAGHLDTVPPAGNAEPRREGDVLHGLGTSDMKGGLAVMLALAEAAAGARREVTFVWYVAEEVADEHNGLRALFADTPELVHGDFAVLLEPTAGWVEAGCQGTVHVEVVHRGRRAHSARPWMGENAIHRGAGTIEQVAAFGSPTVRVEGLDYRESMQVVRIAGGVADNVVPDEVRLLVNRRFAPGRSAAEVVAELEGRFADADEVRLHRSTEAAPPNLSSSLVAEFVGTLDLGVRPKLGWTDVARFWAHGIPACNFGPGDPELAHTPQEAVEGEMLDGVHRVLAAFLGLGPA